MRCVNNACGVSLCVYFKRRQVVIPFPNKGKMGRRDGQQMCEGQEKEKL